MFGRGAKLKMRLLWPCRDGYVTFALMGGKLGAKSNQTVARWISDAGMAPDFFREIDWPALDIAKQTQEEQDRIEAVVAAFFAKHTKAEIYRRANAEGVLLCPQSSCGDILENEQLQSRDFWVQVEHPELGASLTYPGAFPQGDPDAPFDPAARAADRRAQRRDVRRRTGSVRRGAERRWPRPGSFEGCPVAAAEGLKRIA